MAPKIFPEGKQVSKEETDTVLRLFDDRRNLLAAGKIQRWELVKWAVTANVALGAASGSIREMQGMFLAYAVLIAVMALILLWHYNQRMTLVRKSLANVNTFIRNNIIDLNVIGLSKFDEPKPETHDDREMYLFGGAIILSIFPTVFVLWL